MQLKIVQVINSKAVVVPSVGRFGMLGSIDANTGSPDLGWDTDQFPMDIRNCTVAMKVSSGDPVTVTAWGLESLEKPWNLLDPIQGLEILEFYKEKKSLECYCGQLQLFLIQLSWWIIGVVERLAGWQQVLDTTLSDYRHQGSQSVRTTCVHVGL